jgi:transposase
LAELESLASSTLIDLYYGDESHVCTKGYVPYGWQFEDEKISVPSAKGVRLNCLGFIDRQSRCMSRCTTDNIDSEFVIEFLEHLSFNLLKTTVIVLDCAKIHKSRKVKKCIPFWQKRGLFIFYLPPYSPHLNLAETLWRHLKTLWLNPDDYTSKENLFYATTQCLKSVGKDLKIKFSKK